MGDGNAITELLKARNHILEAQDQVDSEISEIELENLNTAFRDVIDGLSNDIANHDN